MEQTLREKGQAAYDEINPRRIAFIQCVGSRDEHAGRGYCSQVCCRYALRLARLLRSRLPEAEITIYKMDIQTCGRDVAAAWNAIANEKIGIVAGLPAVIRRSAGMLLRDFSLRRHLRGQARQAGFRSDHPFSGHAAQARRDGGRQPVWHQPDPLWLLRHWCDETSTLVPGIFVAGSCEAPRSIAESISHARQAAEVTMLYLQESAS